MTPADLDRVAEWERLADAAQRKRRVRVECSVCKRVLAAQASATDERAPIGHTFGGRRCPGATEAGRIVPDPADAVYEMARMIRERDAALATYEQEVLPTVHAVREMADRVGFDGSLDAFVQHKIDIATEWEKRALAALAIAERATEEVRVLREGGGS